MSSVTYSGNLGDLTVHFGRLDRDEGDRAPVPFADLPKVYTLDGFPISEERGEQIRTVYRSRG